VRISTPMFTKSSPRSFTEFTQKVSVYQPTCIP
jgi:hypothetical protein